MRGHVRALKSGDMSPQSNINSAGDLTVIGEKDCLHYCAVARLRGSALNKQHQIFPVPSSVALGSQPKAGAIVKS